MKAVDNSELERLRGIAALDVLDFMAAHAKVDTIFTPVRAAGTCRVHVSAAGREWELLINGTRFFDTRARTGGGGGIDLVMHLWQVPFRQAVKMLVKAGA